MAEEPKKSRRRRRRPRSSARNRPKAAAKSQAGDNASSSSGSRRGRSRRRPSGGKAKKRTSQDALTIQQHTEKPISPIDKDVFIYTYTLRPRSLLDSYEAGPNIAEKMAFEQSKEPLLSE
jgi:hypothetical protein